MIQRERRLVKPVDGITAGWDFGTFDADFLAQDDEMRRPHRVRCPPDAAFLVQYIRSYVIPSYVWHRWIDSQ